MLVKVQSYTLQMEYGYLCRKINSELCWRYFLKMSAMWQ